METPDSLLLSIKSYFEFLAAWPTIKITFIFLTYLTCFILSRFEIIQFCEFQSLDKVGLDLEVMELKLRKIKKF